MGKKVKIGKARKDKFYHLAKETGYRSRASFKLLQLNRKYEFLQTSRVCLDLCAAPGGWSQVASQHMPVSSLIVAVDLVPIRPIPRVTAIQGDITTEKCRQELRGILKTWKADIVLNDGAPNVGKNWVHDAFTQAALALHALKLATEFLRKGGWFITKVFRSKDYHSLMWVLTQLFKKVHATKPQASRNESAEIFVVCQGYLAPDKLDPRFLDPRSVFEDVEDPDAKRNAGINLIHPEKRKKAAEGYADGDYTLYHKLNVSEYLASDDYVDLLANASEIVLDDSKVRDHPCTTGEIIECCKDIKVLGKKEIRNLLNWRKKLLASSRKESKADGSAVDSTEAGVENNSEDEEAKVLQLVAEAQAEKAKVERRKIKKVRKDKAKLRERMNLEMVLPGDKLDVQQDDINLFDLAALQKKTLAKVVQGEMDDAEEPGGEGGEFDDDEPMSKRLLHAYDRHQPRADLYDEGSDDGQDESELEMEEYANRSDDDDDAVPAPKEGKEDEDNPLLVDLDNRRSATGRMDVWFGREAFANLEDDQDEDYELDLLQQRLSGDGTLANQSASATGKKRKLKKDVSERDDGGEEEIGGESKAKDESNVDAATSSSGGDLPEVPSRKAPRLDAVGLALATKMVQSKKTRRDLLDEAYNRYTFNDDNLPDWFAQDEARHMRKELPVTKEEVKEYMERQRAIDARPMKKIAEAKGRRKRKAMRKLERARKKAESVTDAVDVTDKEKWHQIKQIYKKAGVVGKKKEHVTYVVAKRGAGKRVPRPAGVKGRYKVVDPRMKKDRIHEKKSAKKQGGRKRHG